MSASAYILTLALTLIKLFLLVETEQADEDQNELKEEDEFENPTEVDGNDDKSGIIFKEFRFAFAVLLQ